VSIVDKFSLSWLKWQGMALLVLGRRHALDPHNVYALASMAQIESQLGHPARAIELQQALTRQAPGQAHAWFNLGFMLEEAGRLEEAEVAFREATRLSPKLDRAWYGLGLTLIRLRRFDEAVDALRRNTELQPMSPYGWYQLARVHVDRHEPQEAEKIILHLRRFEPKVAAQLERETGLRPAQSA
jgi:predicted Zn-dependent protease